MTATINQPQELTAATITDAQIRELRAAECIGPNVEHFALAALADETRHYYRGICAEILNARTREAK